MHLRRCWFAVALVGCSAGGLPPHFVDVDALEPGTMAGCPAGFATSVDDLPGGMNGELVSAQGSLYVNRGACIQGAWFSGSATRLDLEFRSRALWDELESGDYPSVIVVGRYYADAEYIEVFAVCDTDPPMPIWERLHRMTEARKRQG